MYPITLIRIRDGNHRWHWLQGPDHAACHDTDWIDRREKWGMPTVEANIDRNELSEMIKYRHGISANFNGWDVCASCWHLLLAALALETNEIHQ